MSPVKKSQENDITEVFVELMKKGSKVFGKLADYLEDIHKEVEKILEKEKL